jgi:glycosyltransferase involved in cell wall biosynthesis
MPKVSVIIPTYGIPDRLEKTIQSVLNQTYSDLELIVVDDNNPDTENRRLTTKIVQSVQNQDERLIYICHEKNKNGSAARNTGIRAARGEYISLLDSDDEYTPERIERCINALTNSRDPKAKGVYTGCEYRRNNQKYRVMQNVKSGNFMVDYLAMDFNLFTGSNIFVEKSAAEAINGFDESFARQQDVEFMIRFFEKFDIIGIPDVLVIKNFDGKNKPSAKRFEEIKKHFLDTFAPMIHNLSEDQQRRIYGANYRQLAEQFLVEGNGKKAKYYYSLVKKNGAYSGKVRMRRVVYWMRSFRK